MNTKKTKKELLEQLKKTPVIEIACIKAGIGRTTYYDWCRDDPEFGKAADEALHTGKEFISDVAEGNLIGKVKQGHFQSLIFWLRSHREEYGNKLEIRGQIVHVREELTEEEAQLLRKSLEMAGFSTEVLKELNLPGFVEPGEINNSVGD
jgi:hypothetical protein